MNNTFRGVVSIFLHSVVLIFQAEKEIIMSYHSTEGSFSSSSMWRCLIH